MRNKLKIFMASFLIFAAFLAANHKNQMDDIGTVKTYASGGNNTVFIGHRGFASAAPENTVPSYIRAGHEKFWGGETDINTTKDGKWIVLHDSKIDRMTNGKGRVSALTLKQIKRYHIRSGSHLKLYGKLKVPTFEEYLKTCKDVGIVPVIEFKPDCDITKVSDAIHIIRKYNMAKKCICISFRLPVLMEVRKHANDIKLQWLLSSKLNDDHLTNISLLGRNVGIDIEHKYLSKELIKKCHDNNVEVNCWTVNDKMLAKKYAGWGVDYITSDNISKLKK